MVSINTLHVLIVYAGYVQLFKFVCVCTFKGVQ